MLSLGIPLLGGLTIALNGFFFFLSTAAGEADKAKQAEAEKGITNHDCFFVSRTALICKSYYPYFCPVKVRPFVAFDITDKPCSKKVALLKKSLVHECSFQLNP